MRRLIMLTVLAPGTTAAQADSGLFYLGAGVTDSSLTASNNGYIAYGTPDLKNNSWKAFAGVHPLKWLALEADYIDLGSGSTSTLNNESTNTTHADSARGSHTPSVFCRFRCRWWTSSGRWGSRAGSSIRPLPRTSITSSIPLRLLPWSHRGVTAAMTLPGVSAFRRMSKMFGVRLEYEEFDVDGNSANVASLSVFWSGP